MECLIKIGASIAATIAGYTVAPVGRHLGYIFLYGGYVDKLIAETENLKLLKRTMKVSMDAAKVRGDEIYDEIKMCLREADEVIGKAQKLIDIIDIKCSLIQSFSYLAQRYELSKKAEEMKKSIVEIKGKMRSDNISYRPKLQSNFENKDYLKSATRGKFVGEIMKVLGDGSIRMIGIHGMPGAGKTTFVKEIARKALSKDRRLFDNAVIVTVSQTPKLEDIQQHIAERLGLKLEKKIISERALELQKRLKDEKKFLIILDDLWTKLKLEDVGIVFEGDQKGCKILVTSRFERVLGTDMDVDQNFELKLLSEEEALSWFNVIFGNALKTREFQQLGAKIVKKCGCLPLAIVTVANSLKNCELSTWRDAWTRLENSERDEIVSSSIKLCYDILESDETKKLVSLCSLHEEDADIEMEYLMRYCWGMGMFKGKMTFQNARDRVCQWVNTLKDRCLLLDGYYSGAVKMHDVVRDITISIAKEGHNMHCFRDGREVEEFLKEQKFEDLKAILLPNGYLDELLFERSEYTQLQLMIVIWRRYLKIIPGDFLDRIKLLRVLEFSGSVYFELPKVLASDLSSLQNLRTLCLRASDLHDIAEIGKLKYLEILDLSGSKIEKLPSEIGQLTRLCMFDLTLEDNDTILYLVNYSMEQIHRRTAFCRLEELFLENLSNLKQIYHGEDTVELFKTLRVVTVRACECLKNLLPLFNARQIEEIEILACDEMEEIFTLQIQDDGDDNDQVIEEFLQLRSLKLEYLPKLREICSLKKIGLTSQKEEGPFVGDSDIMPLFNVKFRFPKLEKLVLHRCDAAKKLWDDQLVPSSTSFCFLTKLELFNCKCLKYVFSSSIAASLKQLYSLVVRYCDAMEEIVRRDERIVNISFPQLYSLWLGDLPKLSTFSSGIFVEFSLLNDLRIEYCPELKTFVSESSEDESNTTMPSFFNKNFLCFPKLGKLELVWLAGKKLWDAQRVPSSTSFCFLTKLVVHDCRCLKYVFSSSIAASFKQLCSLVVRGCDTMEEIVNRDEWMDNISFPKLYSLWLRDLPKLSTFSSGIFVEFSLLNDLRIWDCPELKTFVSESSEDSSNTTMPSFFNKNAAFPSLKRLMIGQMEGLKMIWQNGLCNINTDSFWKLEEVKVGECKNLRGIFPSVMHTRLGNLRNLVISGCQKMEEIFVLETPNCTGIQEVVGKREGLETVLPRDHDDEFVLPRLLEMYLTSLPNLVSIYAGTHNLRFPSLKKLRVKECHEMHHLLSSQTAKSMAELGSLKIGRCERMVEIISDAGVDTRGCEIVFPGLKHLSLYSLPRLTSFYSGNCTMKFPNLNNLGIYGCFEMQSFSKHDIISTSELRLELELESLSDSDSESELELESEVSSNRIVDDINTINIIIAEHWMSHHPGTALQELFTEEDLASSNVSAE